MTEEEWLGAWEAGPLLRFIDGEAITLVDRAPLEQRDATREHLATVMSDRKRRLLACAFVRQIWDWLADDRSRRAVEAAERFADGLATEFDLAAARSQASRARDEAWDLGRRALPQGVPAVSPESRRAAAAALLAVRFDVAQTADECAPVLALFTARELARREQADVARDLFGNPFRPPRRLEPTWLAWTGGAVRHLAAVIYDTHGFHEMPVLADALADAGCDDEALLAHLRGPGPHARGCYVLDLILRGP